MLRREEGTEGRKGGRERERRERERDRTCRNASQITPVSSLELLSLERCVYYNLSDFLRYCVEYNTGGCEQHTWAFKGNLGK
jgi:hypothetical protein